MKEETKAMLGALVVIAMFIFVGYGFAKINRKIFPYKIIKIKNGMFRA